MGVVHSGSQWLLVFIDLNKQSTLLRNEKACLDVDVGGTCDIFTALSQMRSTRQSEQLCLGFGVVMLDFLVFLP